MKFKEHYTIRKPAGPHLVGCTRFTCEYALDGQPRVIPCLCWYPASVTSGKPKRYADERIHASTGSIETNAFLDAPIVDGRHPLLLFSHGFALFNESNTVQCEALASHGYIVVSIGHPGGGSYELPNGDFQILDMAQLMKDYEADASGMALFTPYGLWLACEGQSATLDEHRAHYKPILESQPGFMAQSEIWLKDSLVALDKLVNEDGQASPLLHRHIDWDRVGAFGMSFGGAAALNLTHVSDVVKASANLDGFVYGQRWEQPLTKPVLLMQNDMGHLLTFPFLNAAGDAYLVTFRNSTHANFADYNELLAENYIARGVYNGEEIEQPMLGKIDPDEAENLLNTFLLDFFNKYLRGEPAHIIDGDTLPDEVIVQRK